MITSLTLLLIAIAVVFFFFVVFVISRLYKRTSTDMAFVRTGLGSAKVCASGGIIVLPIFQQVTPVSLASIKLTVSRNGINGFMSKNRIRFDASMEVFVNVENTHESILKAARTLGDKTLNASAFSEFIESKVISAIRSAAAKLEFFEIHEKRQELVSLVIEALAEDINRNGLQLESVSLTYFDQTSIDALDQNSVFDSEGLSAITDIIQSKAVLRNQLEQDASAKMAKDTYQATALKEDLRVQTAKKQNDAEAQVRVDRAASENQAQVAEIEMQQGIEIKKQENQNQLKLIQIDQDKDFRLAQQKSQIEVNQSAAQEAESQAKTSEAKAIAVAAEESIVTAKKIAEAKRDADMEVITAEGEARKANASILIAAETRAQAASLDAQAVKIETEANVAAEQQMLELLKQKGIVIADNIQKENEAKNTLSDKVIQFELQKKLIETLPAIIEQMVKPMEKISDIKMVQINGSLLGGGSGGSGESGSSASLPEQMVDGALKFKVGNALLDRLMGSIGLSGADLSGMVQEFGQKNVTPLDAQATDVTTAPVEAPTTSDLSEIPLPGDAEPV